MSNDTNKRERQKREEELARLGLRPVDDRPRCLHCQIPMDGNGAGLLCAACDGD
ncbi:hypothetical protein JQ543_30725 [Bradyrhizobium diazoefficiens]|nr:hypothetical protein [Bradyrhizobium diazoefficiens]MBR0852145.1 hypothetical protein [Bradyrhizobium diazoefficiens]